MKLINRKTAIIMLSSVALLALSGCDSKTGIPSSSQLIGTAIPPSGVTPPPEIIPPPLPVSKIVLPLCTEFEGSEPWTSDGTAVGTSILKDINVGAEGTLPRKMGGNGHKNKFVTIGLETFFPAKMLHTGENSEPYETVALWKSDGTTAGTVMLKDFNKSLDDKDGLAQMAVMGGNLYFRGWDEEYGYQIWKSNGNPEGTVRVTNFEVNDVDEVYDHNIGGLRAMGDIVFFHASEEYDGRNELWTTDGTDAGTSMLKITEDSDPDRMKVVEGKLYFRAISDREPWVSDGTEVGTMMIKELRSNHGSDPYGFTAYNGLVYFSAYGTTSGQELYQTDGTAEGTKLVKDIFPGNNSYDSPNSSNPTNFKVLNGVLYFIANDGIGGNELWKTDGTEQNTLKAFGTEWDKLDFPEALQVANSKLFFRAEDNERGYRFLYTYDGIATGPQSLTDEKNTDPGNFRVVDNELWFMVETTETTTDDKGGDALTALWKTDGTEQGTVMIKDKLCPSGTMDGNTNIGEEEN